VLVKIPFIKREITDSNKESINFKKRFKPFLDLTKGKKVYLALSGGGLALVCHIGIVRLIELLGIKVEKVFGTSAGAIIGGLYAAGLTSEQMEDAALRLSDPDDLFGRFSKHVILRAVKGEFQANFVKGGFQNSGIYDAKRLEEYIEEKIIDYFGKVPLLGELQKSYSAIAFNIGSGKLNDIGLSSKKIFSTDETPEVSLKDAIIASISIPGIFMPKKIGDFYYIDGSVVENLPVISAYEDWRKKKKFYGKNLVIIAVDIGYGGETLVDSERIKPHDMMLYSIGIGGKTINLYSLLRVHKPRNGSQVVLLKPRRYNIGLTDFEKIPFAIEKSYKAIVKQLEGKNYLNETHEDIKKARIMLGINEKEM